MTMSVAEMAKISLWWTLILSVHSKVLFDLIQITKIQLTLHSIIPYFCGPYFMKSSVSDSIDEIELLECISVNFPSHKYPKSFQFPKSFHFLISSNLPKVLKSM